MEAVQILHLKSDNGWVKGTATAIMENPSPNINMAFSKENNIPLYKVILYH